MDARVGLLVLFVLGANWACEARQLENPFILGKFMAFFLQFFWDIDITLECLTSTRVVTKQISIMRY